MSECDEVDRRIVLATQAGLPLLPAPYAEVARLAGTTEEDVIVRLRRMIDSGVVRRIGVVPNHYALGYRFNGMTVWDIRDEAAREMGGKVGALPFVSHCYLRPRLPPDWPYNLFAMVHGRDRETAMAHAAAISAVVNGHCRNHKVLFSSRILKKSGLRIAG